MPCEAGHISVLRGRILCSEHLLVSISAPGRSRTCVSGFGRRSRVRWTTGAMAEDAGFEPARRSSRRPPFSKRLPFRARPILPGTATVSRCRARAARRGIEPRSPRSERGVRANWTTGHQLSSDATTWLPVQGSNLGSRIQSPPCCRLHQPGPGGAVRRVRESNPRPRTENPESVPLDQRAIRQPSPATTGDGPHPCQDSNLAPPRS